MNNIQQAPAEHLTDLVKLLTETPGPSGAEHRIRAAVIDQISGLADEARTDALGKRQPQTPREEAQIETSPHVVSSTAVRRSAGPRITSPF